MKKILVSKFDGIKSNMSYVTVNLWDWLLDGRYRDEVNQIRHSTDAGERKALKSKLPAITPSGVFHTRDADSLITPSNLICIDIDGKDNPSISDMEELKARLAKLPYVMYCGLSASGTGLFCIIPYEDYRKHRLYFHALEQDFRDMGIVVDSHCSDICRLRFYSYDEHPYVNPDAEVYTKTLEKPSAMRSRPYHKPSTDIQESPDNEVTENLSMEEMLLRPSNLDFVSATPLSKTQMAERLLNLAIERQIDITAKYRDWFIICCIIKNLFGEKGAELFHKVSSFYPDYDYEKTENLFQKTDSSRYRYNSDRLFEIAAKYGIHK